MLFEIHAERSAQDKKIFYYDNETNTLKDAEGHTYEYPEIPQQDLKPFVPFDRKNPLKKSRAIRHLKIQLGLSCNYSCDYC